MPAGDNGVLAKQYVNYGATIIQDIQTLLSLEGSTISHQCTTKQQRI